MARSNSGNDPAKGLPPVRSARMAAQQRAEQPPADDPEVLAEEIEKTREDLAETLDAIVDKVSPARVTARTKKKVADTAKQNVADAADTVKGKAAGAGETLKEAAGTLKGKAASAGGSLKEVAGGGADPADPAGPPPASVPDVDGAMASIEPDGSAETELDIEAVPAKPGAVTVTPDVQRPSVAPVVSDLVGQGDGGQGVGGQGEPEASPFAPQAQSRTPMLAGAAAAVAVLLFLLRRRRR